MGNSQHRYITNNEATEIIGNDNWTRLRTKLERGTMKTIDFGLFCNILQSRFERIPVQICECLFRGFTSDFQQRLDVEVFLSSFAVLFSNDLSLKRKFLFRIYESNPNEMDRKRTEEILQLAYGEKLKGNFHKVSKVLDGLFQKKKETITKAKFEVWQGDLDLLSEWVIEVLRIFYEPLPARLYDLQLRYSPSMEAESIRSRFNIPTEVYHRLTQQFSIRCNTSFRSELYLAQWKQWVTGFLSPALAEIVFVAATEVFKHTWRFMDFAEFALIYGIGSLETRANAITTAFLKFAILSRGNHENPIFSFDTVPPIDSEISSPSNLLRPSSCNPEFDVWLAETLSAMVFHLFQPLEIVSVSADCPSPQAQDEADTEEDVFGVQMLQTENSSSNLETPPLLDKRRKSYSLNVSAEPLSRGSSIKVPAMSSSADGDKKSTLAVSPAQLNSLPEPIRESLRAIYASPSQTAESYVQLLVKHSKLLSSFRDLSILACCQFGVVPLSPVEEKEYITELTLRYFKQYPPSQQRPYGPIGTEWFIISKGWIDSWRMFVGKNGVEQYSSTGNDVGAQRSTYSARRSSLAPSVIDNWSILRKTGARALLPGLSLGQDFEVLPPSVYTAFACWYGGGPAVCRRVIKSSKEQAREDKDSPDGTQTEIEFYPFSVFIVECDVHGKVAGQPREYLFSRTIKVQDAIHELSIERKLDASKIRLWNYAKTNWKEQYIVSPELTLQQANILDEQTILMETSMPDGSWPRSQLHAYLDSEDKQSESNEKVHDAAEVDKHPSSEQEASDSKKGKVRRNNGLVGMDNLGNTCYLNSSLQALLHTDLLVEYFLSQSYLKDINVVNKHGFGGKMANIFGKVMLDLWTTNRDCITPRYFYNEIASLRDQFAGNEQHDAHELLAFLLDALSEDLNMVHSKPYTIQPDSDGRPDHVLADIWWENHLKRDRSVIQALFTGQFKSVMNCSCGYSSARFEPFNFLTVPIPEDSFRVMMVIVVPRSLDQTSRCAVRVPKTGTVENIIEKVKELGFEGMKSGELQYFVAGELVNSRIKSFINLDRKLDTIRDNELLVLFHVTAAPKKMEKYYNKFRTLPTATNGEERRASHGEPSVEEQLQSSSQDSSSAPAVHFVRVAFSQRRISYMDGPFAGVAGFDFFRLEAFGVPILEVLPNRIKAAELYRLMEQRLGAYFKTSVAEYRRHQKKHKSASSLLHTTGPRRTEDESRDASPAHSPLEESEQSRLDPDSAAPVDRAEQIASFSTDEVLAGPIPSKGFTLRLVTGGTGSSVCCSRCSWLSRCQGCVLPDREDVEYELLDGESIAVDWHFVIFEDLLDTQLASTLLTHSSVAQEKSYLQDTKIPLHRCLDKFNEQESLEGVVCPRCHEENSLKKTFMLWRLPPVLIVQLKRFQFDRTSRRKLNNRIDFPLENLNLENYLARSRLKDGAGVTDPASVQLNLSAEFEEPKSMTEKDSEQPQQKQGELPLSTEYNLYSVIHHIGALGGGHYVSSVRFRGKEGARHPQSLKAKLLKSFRSLTSHAQSEATEPSAHDSLDASTNSAPSEAADASRWFMFNDNLVSEVSDLADISAPSAYVLFYVRKDLENSHDIEAVLKSQLMLGTDEEEARNQRVPSKGEPTAETSQLAEPATAKRVETASSDSDSRRNNFIVARKMHFPSPKKTARESSGGERDGDRGSQSTSNPIPPALQPSSSAGPSQSAAPNGDNCTVS